MDQKKMQDATSQQDIKFQKVIVERMEKKLNRSRKKKEVSWVGGGVRIWTAFALHSLGT